MVQKVKTHISKNLDLEPPESEKRLRLTATENYFHRHANEIAAEIELKE